MYKCEGKRTSRAVSSEIHNCKRRHLGDVGESKENATCWEVACSEVIKKSEKVVLASTFFCFYIFAVIRQITLVWLTYWNWSGRTVWFWLKSSVKLLNYSIHYKIFIVWMNLQKNFWPPFKSFVSAFFFQTFSFFHSSIPPFPSISLVVLVYLSDTYPFSILLLCPVLEPFFCRCRLRKNF